MYRPPVWPSVVGIIAMVLAVLSILSCVWGGLSILFAESMGQSFGMTKEAMKPQSDHPWLMGLYYLFTALLAGWLLMGGVRLYRRDARGPRLLVQWSIIKFPETALSTWITIIMQQAQMRSAGAASGTNAPGQAFMSAFSDLVVVFTGLGVVAYGLSFPIFLLFWFRRASIKAQIAAWKPRNPTPLPTPSSHAM